MTLESGKGVTTCVESAIGQVRGVGVSVQLSKCMLGGEDDTKQPKQRQSETGLRVV